MLYLVKHSSAVYKRYIGKMLLTHAITVVQGTSRVSTGYYKPPRSRYADRMTHGNQLEDDADARRLD
jgi:hypothetical protein